MRNMVQHLIRNEVSTDDCQRCINQFHDKLYIQLGQGNHYAVDLYGLDGFVNNNFLNHFEGKEDARLFLGIKQSGSTWNILHLELKSNNSILRR